MDTAGSSKRIPAHSRMSVLAHDSVGVGELTYMGKYAPVALHHPQLL